MTSRPSSFSVAVDPGGRVTAVEYPAAGSAPVGATLVLAHGAGAGQQSPFMKGYAAALAARGLPVITFDFPYTEHRRRLPDRAPILEACWRAVIDAVTARVGPDTRLVAGGKSMGGRIASQVAAADGEDSPLTGLVFLGYPLHPPGRPEQRRDAHLPRIRVPMLFVQGSRDAFGSPDELAVALRSAGGLAELHIVDGGDHSFHVPKKWPVAQADVDGLVQDAIVAWVTGEARRGRRRAR
jgi:uncharacterized protein